MGSSKPPGLGMPRLMAFSCHWVLFDESLILILFESDSWFFYYYFIECGWPSNYRKFKEINCLLEGCNEHAFSMTDLELLSQFLGLEIDQSQHGIKVHQSKYALVFMNKFNMKYCKPIKIGRLLYLTHTRPDLSYVVSK